MSNHVLPMLYFNLGGEMLYVLDQRLRAQKVALQRGNKVMGEIVVNMFSKTFMEDLFKPQAIYSRRAMRSLFEKLVHSSIMRVDADSMEKLYDLMVMTFKHQVIKCPNPRDLLQVTLNHFDEILQFVSSNAEAKKLVMESFKQSVKLYDEMPLGDLIFVKQSLLGFLHDSKSKVSIFVNMKAQNRDGTFVVPRTGNVPVGTDIPGVISFYNNNGIVTEKFTVGSNFGSSKIKDSSVEIGGLRSTTLGMNLYAHDYGNECALESGSQELSSQNLAKAEVNLLSHLIGAKKTEGDFFKLDLFNADNVDVSKVSSSSATVSSNSNTIEIKAEKSGENELSKIMDDFKSISTSKSSGDDDLLSLMDDL
uniref:protein OSCP1-like n=1 Tax=Styela clava TaxID=7725 RepID=UPI001939B376|nr:protein OSCP1-like [Styela clava]